MEVKGKLFCARGVLLYSLKKWICKCILIWRRKQMYVIESYQESCHYLFIIIIDIVIIIIFFIVISEYFQSIIFSVLYQYVQVKSCYLPLSWIRSLSKKGGSRFYERFRKEINMLLTNGRFWKEINRLLSKGIWHICLNVSIEKKWYT